MRFISRLSSFFIIFCLTAISCTIDNIKPAIVCDGTLNLTLESKSKSQDCAAHDGLITVAATGGLEPYQFSLNGGTKQASSTFDGLAAGVFTVIVFDANNCQASVSDIALEVTTTLDLAITITADTQCSGNNGAISLVGTGGSGTILYKLGSGSYSSTTNYPSLGAGVYSVSIKDDSGCEKSLSVTVPQGNTGTTYDNSIATIINTNCTASNCHGSGSHNGPGELTTYSKVNAAASSVYSAVFSGSMPRDASKLSDSQIQLIACWISDGKPN